MKALGIWNFFIGVALAGLDLYLFTKITVTDSPWRWLGFLLALGLFVGGLLLAMRANKANLNSKAGKG